MDRYISLVKFICSLLARIGIDLSVERTATRVRPVKNPSELCMRPTASSGDGVLHEVQKLLHHKTNSY